MAGPSVNVLFATNRNRVDGDKLAPFGTDVGSDLFWGTATVNDIDIQAPSSGKISGFRDGFTAGAPATADLDPILTSTNDVLVFIHGAANDFTDSITRAAYNRTWLAASGLQNSTFDVIAFSWPARSYFIANIVGDYFDYRADQRAAEGSAQQLSAFLGQIDNLRFLLRQGPRRRRLNLLCHSMGNYALGWALPSFLNNANLGGRTYNAARGDYLFDEVVLAAADEDAATFAAPNGDRLSRLREVGREITVYFNNDDLAMDLSHLVNGDYRLGYDGPANTSDTAFFPTAIYEFVDSTGVNDYISGPLQAPDRSHQYYRQSPTVRADIVASLAGFTPVRPVFDPVTNVYTLFPPAPST